MITAPSAKADEVRRRKNAGVIEFEFKILILVDGNAARESHSERELGNGPLNGLLTRAPYDNRLGFLGRERRENELRKLSLPGHRFGFIHCKAK